MTKKCARCGRGIHTGGRGRPPRYCSRSCQAKAYRARSHPPEPGPAAPSAIQARRRRTIIEAVWRIAAERGLESASVREIAAEAGVSTRVVQYHFADKHRILIAALEALHAENETRARVHLEALGETSRPRELLRTVFEEFLPLDARRRQSLLVLTAYYARSLTDPELARVFLADADPLEELVTGIIAANPGIDPRHEARLLVSGVSGLALDLLHGTRSLEEIRATIDYHVRRVL